MDTQQQIQVRVYKARAVLFRKEADDFGNRAPEQSILLRAKADLEDARAEELRKHINQGRSR